MSTITVRQAVLSDLESLVPIFDAYRQFYGRESDVDAVREFLLERFNHGESVLFLAFDSDTPVGFIQLYPSFSSVSLARTFVLNDLYVLESARRKGVASDLVAAVVRYANTVGAVRLSVAAASSNETAQSLYKVSGWKRDELFSVFHYGITS